MQQALPMADRLEEARKHCQFATLEAASSAMWPNDPKRRTRYSTVLRTLAHGGSVQWASLEPIIGYYARRGFHLAWLLFGMGPKSTLVSGKPPDLMPEKIPSSGLQLRRRA